MHKYETLVVLHPDLADAQVKETIERTRKLIEAMQGTIDQVQEWGSRELAYPIRKQLRGIYVLLQFTSRPDVVKEMERTFRISDDVLRFVSVRMPDPSKVARRAAKVKPAIEPEAGAQEARQGE